MIKSFRHKGLERFFLTGSKAGITAAHAVKLQIRLTALDAATVETPLAHRAEPEEAGCRRPLVNMDNGQLASDVLFRRNRCCSC
jgi:hypothetical protein